MKRSNQWLVSLGLLGLLASARASPAAAGVVEAILALPLGGPRGFSLQDQHGREVRGDELDQQVWVVIGGNRKASELSRAWALEVRQWLAGDAVAQEATRVLQVADLRGVPKLFEPAVRSRLASRYSTSVLLDWEGDLAGRFQFAPGLANVVVIDPAGRVLFRRSGKQPGSEDAAELRRVLMRVDPRQIGNCREVLDGSSTSEVAMGRWSGHPFWREML